MTETAATTTVLGAGTMGAGIAQCLADHGRQVTLCDLQPMALERARERIAASRLTLENAGLQTHAQSHRGDSLLEMTTSLPAAVADVNLVIEAVPEDLELKCDVFAQLDELAPPHAALVSNTSGLWSLRIPSSSPQDTWIPGWCRIRSIDWCFLTVASPWRSYFIRTTNFDMRTNVREQGTPYI